MHATLQIRLASFDLRDKPMVGSNAAPSLDQSLSPLPQTKVEIGDKARRRGMFSQFVRGLGIVAARVPLPFSRGNSASSRPWTVSLRPNTCGSQHASRNKIISARIGDCKSASVRVVNNPLLLSIRGVVQEEPRFPKCHCGGDPKSAELPTHSRPKRAPSRSQLSGYSFRHS